MKTHVTVVVPDKLIIVDGHLLHFNFNAPAELHAIQWHDGAGHLEFTDDYQELAAADYATEVAPFVALWEAEKARLESLIVEPPELNIAERAATVQMTQREFILLVETLTAQTPGMTPITWTEHIKPAIYAMDNDTIRDWELASYVERSNPFLVPAAAHFGFSADLLDIMFANKDALLAKIAAGEPLTLE